MSPAPAPTLVAAVEVRVDGTPIDPRVAERLLEARVQDNLMLPDAFTLRLRDPHFELVDGTLFDVGAEVELRFAPTGASLPAPPFSGEVATIAPQFEAEGCVLVVRGYDVSHRLHRGHNTRTFQDMTAGDIAAKVVGEAGLPIEVEPTADVYAFEQQSNETDWDFLWRLARRCSYELACSGKTIHFRSPGPSAGPPVKLDWGQNLRAFHPRATAVGQVKSVTVSGWDPKAGRRISASAQTAKLDSSIGLRRDDIAGTLGGASAAVADEIVGSQGEADALAQSTLDRVANAWLEAEGTSRGNPHIRAGSEVEIGGVGTRFGGRYLVTKSTHVMRGRSGYQTEFEISGRSRRTLIDLLTPAAPAAYPGSLVVGIVTNVDDPDAMGRVRVKFPGLDERCEGWWARVAGVGSGPSSAVKMTPRVDDEVVVGFEHGDPRRPFVLGYLQRADGRQANGSAPAKLDLRSDEELAIAAAGDLRIAGEAKVDARASTDLALHAGGRLALTGDGARVTLAGPQGSVVIHKDGSIAISAARVTVDAASQLDLTSNGVVTLHGSQIMLG